MAANLISLLRTENHSSLLGRCLMRRRGLAVNPRKESCFLAKQRPRAGSASDSLGCGPFALSSAQQRPVHRTVYSQSVGLGLVTFSAEASPHSVWVAPRYLAPPQTLVGLSSRVPETRAALQPISFSCMLVMPAVMPRCSSTQPASPEAGGTATRGARGELTPNDLIAAGGDWRGCGQSGD
jgi:hypothetical protein